MRTLGAKDRGSERDISIAVDARIAASGHGGIRTVIAGIAQGLAQLEGPERYHFLAYPGQDSWLRPHLGDNSSILHWQRTGWNSPARSIVLAGTNRVRRSASRVRNMTNGASQRLDWLSAYAIRGSDGTIENHGIDVMHFTFQQAFITRVPSLYHPHDLLHIHIPELFEPDERAMRDRLYRTHCNRADVVATASSWVRNDVIAAYQLDPGRVAVIPFAPLKRPEPRSDVARKLLRSVGLEGVYALYPAQAWPHKNHVKLIQALARLRRLRGLSVPVVCTGAPTGHESELAATAATLGVEDLVKFVGFVEPAVLSALFDSAQLVVVPTLFEAASFPIWEAFQAGVPVACSTVTSLPRQVGDAALLFDPLDADSIAEAIQALWSDESARHGLIAAGRVRVAPLTWARTARHFRAHYRRIARVPLSAEDKSLLSEPPLI